MGFIQRSFLKLLFLVLFATSCIQNNNGFNRSSYCIKNFPLIEQPDEITCGPTSACMLLKFYGHNLSVNNIKYKSHTYWFDYGNKPIGMTSPCLLTNALTECGLPCSIFQGNLNELKRNLQKDKPVIVLLRHSQFLWHYMVAIGFDKENIVLANPANGKKIKLKNNIFSNAWDFSADLKGNNCSSGSIVFMLNLTEVYPCTMIVPIV